MATLTASDMFTDYPELTTVDATELTQIGHFLDIAEDVIGSDAFSTTTLRDRCRLAVAAHLTAQRNADTCSGSSGTKSGPVTGRTRGSRSVTYAAPSGAQLSGAIRGMDLSSTRYGQMALMLLAGARHRRGVLA